MKTTEATKAKVLGVIEAVLPPDRTLILRVKQKRKVNTPKKGAGRRLARRLENHE